MEPNRPSTTELWEPPDPGAAEETAVATPTTRVRPAGPGLARISVFLGGCLILLGAAAAAFAGSAPATSGSAGTGAVAPAAAGAPSLHGGLFGHGLLGGGITITAISGSNVSLATENGWTRTIDATGATITKDGAAAQLSDLEVGDSVGLREQRNDDGTWTVTQIVVVPARVAGTVGDVGDTSFTIRLPDGTTKTITLTAATTYTLGREAATKAALQSGLHVVVAGDESGGTFTATRVHLAQPRVGGIVTAKTASTITVAIGDGTTRTINVDSATTFRVAGVENAGLDDIAVNSAVVATGTLNADGSLDATAVASGNGRKFDFGFGFGGGKGRGPGGPGFGPFGVAPAPEASPDTSDGTS
jgi:hypothetical protein